MSEEFKNPMFGTEAKNFHPEDSEEEAAALLESVKSALDKISAIDPANVEAMVIALQLKDGDHADGLMVGSQEDILHLLSGMNEQALAAALGLTKIKDA